MKDGKFLVLVVEDDIDTRDNIKARLIQEGYEVVTCFDGLRALEVIRKQNVDFVVLDIMIPGLIGYHLCRLVKFDERFQHLPILVLTAKTDAKFKQLSERAGADRFLTKPFDMNKLVTVINSYFKEGREHGGGTA
ncbi:MAG: response regulator [Planctomycetota bacterium]|nr:response regulator [Planctomycetota bacterium]